VVDKESVRALLERYCAAMSEGRREDWLDCFADDAFQEDPVGASANVGRAAIGAFFDANEVPVTLTLTSDPLIVGREVIGFFQAVAELNGNKMRLPRIIDHIMLTEDGARIQSLRAFFDYAEMVPASE
jgi:steroid delta-isomerase